MVDPVLGISPDSDQFFVGNAFSRNCKAEEENK